MAVNNRNSECAPLGNGSIPSKPVTAIHPAHCDPDPQHQSSEEPRVKVSPNGCLAHNGVTRACPLFSDNQRAPIIAPCCQPCSYHHHPLSSQQECVVRPGGTVASAQVSGGLPAHTEFPTTNVCQNHLHMYHPACCVQPSQSFCLHQWRDHFQHQQVPHHLVNIRKCSQRCVSLRLSFSYAALIADWPVVVLGMCTVLIVVCALVGILVPDLPDFSDPLLGFEPRGTAIGQRLVTWNNMVKNTGYKATLANYPFKYADEQAKNHQDDRWSEDHFEREKRGVDWNFHRDSFFCAVPSNHYSRVVFTSEDGENLWNLQAIKSMCNIDNTRVSAIKSKCLLHSLQIVLSL
uniref:Dispatched RND transporter family member 1 n=1 Tax=Leptobrachium leishanense TaxID=445787 RepID=A0A8C5MW30_9ANUR